MLRNTRIINITRHMLIIRPSKNLACWIIPIGWIAKSELLSKKPYSNNNIDQIVGSIILGLIPWITTSCC